MQQPLTLNQIRNDPNLYLSYYAYTLNIASLAAGATDSDTINIENDSQFVWTKTAYFADVAGGAQENDTRVIPLINVQLVDSGSARQFFDEPQPVNSIGGQGAIPFILPAPFIFKNNANINGAFSNFSAATTYANFRLTLHGYRVYQYGNSIT